MFQPLRPLFAAASLALLCTLALSGCSGNENSEPCPAGEERNPITGKCTPETLRRGQTDTGGSNHQSPDGGTASPSDAGTSGGADTGGGDIDTGETGETGESGETGETGGSAPDTGAPKPDTDPAPACDQDQDGFEATSCGGRDCNDANPGTNPDARELCDTVDNDCDGTNNNGVDCTFYAHSQKELYEIDPFAKTLTKVQTTNAPGSDFFDIDTHPDGTLYTLAGSALWKLDRSNRWQRVGATGGFGTPNGLAIDRRGTGFATGGSRLSKVNVSTAAVSRLGSTSPYTSSGDCVIGKKGTLMMTATGGGNDVLVEVDSRNGSTRKIGSTDHDEIWGLTAAWGRLYGVTNGGHLIEIDDKTGASTTIQRFSGVSFYGAASTPASRRSN